MNKENENKIPPMSVPMPDGFSAFTSSNCVGHDGPVVGLCMLRDGEVADDLIMIVTPEYARALAAHIVAAADRAEASVLDLSPTVQ